MNNKGFAITTILYGTLILFLMLLLSMLGILSTYKDRLSLLIDSNNGARCIINKNCSESEMGTTISFSLEYTDTINGSGKVTMEALSGMTWNEWLSSKYTRTISDNYFFSGSTGFQLDSPNDKIVAYYNYISNNETET